MDTVTFGGDAASTVRALDRLAADARQRADRFTNLRNEVQAATITEESRDGTVRATVQTSGVLVDLELGDRAADQSPAELAADVLATVRRAQSRIADTAAQLTEQNGLSEDPAAQRMLSRLAEQYPDAGERAAPDTQLHIGELEEETPSEPPPATEYDEPPREETEWGQQSFLRDS